VPPRVTGRVIGWSRDNAGELHTADRRSCRSGVGEKLRTAAPLLRCCRWWRSGSLLVLRSGRTVRVSRTFADRLSSQDSDQPCEPARGVS
jgi:hypothetical protein